MNFKSFLQELKKSFLDYKLLLTTAGKDAIFFSFFSLSFILYYFIISKSIPADPGFDAQTIFQASPQIIAATTSALNTFYTIFVISTIIGITLILSAFIFIKEWVWTGIGKTKMSYKDLPKFLGLNLVIYTIVTLFVIGVMILAGMLMQKMAVSGFALISLQALAILILIIIIPLSMQLINYSSYTFIKKRKFLISIIEPFKSFSKVGKLWLPYAAILLVLSVSGFLSNYLTSFANTFLSIIGLTILLLFMAWQRIYSYNLFESLKNK